MEILSVDQCYAADRLAVESGVDSYDLMQAAGRAVAEAAVRFFPAVPVSISCGFGANGGDGFVAARELTRLGREVSVYLLGDRDALSGDAARAAADWTGAVAPLSLEAVSPDRLIIDALFGAGLSRPLSGLALELAKTAAASGAPVLSVDLPSGVQGDTAAPVEGGAAFQAAMTMTFFRKKPAHVLYPGAALCGEVKVREIGTPDNVLAEIKPRLFENTPKLWGPNLPRPGPGDHKHSRGRLGVVSGPAIMTGAARLSAKRFKRSPLMPWQLAQAPGGTRRPVRPCSACSNRAGRRFWTQTP